MVADITHFSFGDPGSEATPTWLVECGQFWKCICPSGTRSCQGPCLSCPRAVYWCVELSSALSVPALCRHGHIVRVVCHFSFTLKDVFEIGYLIVLIMNSFLSIQKHIMLSG